MRYSARGNDILPAVMKGRSFLSCPSGAISLLCRPASVDEAVALARTALDAGADGVTVELNRFPVAARTLAGFREIVSSVPLPFMFTDYREDEFLGADDEARMASLLTAAEAGAEFVDVMADLYCPSPLQIATDEAAVARQRAAIDAVHRLGAKVILSSHILDRARTADEIVAQLRMEAARGADVVKLVTMMDTSEAFVEGVRAMTRLRTEMKTPWVFLAGGQYGRMQRFLGPHFGCAIEFAVHDYLAGTPYNQPTIRNFKKAAAAIAWQMPDDVA